MRLLAAIYLQVEEYIIGIVLGGDIANVNLSCTNMFGETGLLNIVFFPNFMAPQIEKTGKMIMNKQNSQ